MRRLRIVVGGFLGLFPAGGVVWDYVQYPLGLAQMGHDVFYIEDTRLYPVYQKPGSNWGDCSASVEHLKTVMESFGFADRWAYRDEASGRCFGMSLERVKQICAGADVFINISCSTYLRNEYRRIPVRALIDSDPMFTQIQYLTQQSFTPGEAGLREMVDGHTHWFTFGENIGRPHCRMPGCGLTWHPTRQPICLNHWPVMPIPDTKPATFTTLMNWSVDKKLFFEGETWGQKDVEFSKVETLPSRLPDTRLAMAVTRNNAFTPEVENRLTGAGWQVLNPEQHAGDWQSYRRFIQQSTGEFSVAKETYVKGQTGWFSCRSACYLAAGRPVVTQDTGWSDYIPTGEGLFSFSNQAEAAAGVDRILTDPERHARVARELAEAYFDSKKVLGELLERL